MKKRLYYYPTNDGAMLPFLQNLCAKAPNYLTQLDITGGDVSFLTLMCALWNNLTDFQNRAKRFAEDWTSLRKACFDGPPNSPAPAWPVWNGPGTSPVGLTTGCDTKLRGMIKRWKTAPGFTEAIGEDLGIIGDEIILNPTTAQTEVQVNMKAGRPQISAPLLGFDSVEFQVNRGTGFELLDVSTGAPVTDQHPLPPLGESDVWTYRAILRMDNQPVGQWSLNLPVPVIGI